VNACRLRRTLRSRSKTQHDRDGVIVHLAEYVDHQRTPEFDERLFEAMRSHARMALDASRCKEIDSDWLTLIARVSVEARESGKRVVVFGLSDALRRR
jgi:anti-anti-sigma regulatory factor